jgi:sugar O-acyltransferase (sialic acid O-acetyltransferase NeuD family)
LVTQKIIIIGAGGFGREVLWTITECNNESIKYDILGFVDDDPNLHNKQISNLPVLGDIDWILSSSLNDVGFVIAIGENKIRKKIVQRLKHKNLKFPIIIHPSSHCASSVNLMEGTIIQAGSIISVDVSIGKHSYINFNCTIGHDTIIDDFVTLSPGVNISGTNKIKTGVMIGTGAATKQNISIGEWSIIGGGTMIGKNISSYSVYYGSSGKMKNFQSV